MTLRQALIRRLLETLQPRMLLVDYTLAGAGGELRDILVELRAARARPVLVHVFRDIDSEPHLTATHLQRSGLAELLDRVYDLILVVGDREVFDTTREYQFSPAAVAKTIHVEVEAGEPVAISGDPARLQQVVWNLLSNAVKFTPTGGRITVHVAAVDGHAELQVTDTGVGIPPSFLPYVFDKFRQADASFTRQYGGLGLGLAIARHLIELHGGSIEARSAGEGSGATFVVRLPYPARAAAS